MKAVYITGHGGPDALTLGDRPDPKPGPNDALIRVRACALNRLDLYARAGERGTRLALDEPHILGGDIAGDVVEVGSEVTRLAVGERVVVNPRITCRQCPACVAGSTELCERPGMIGATANGGYAELAIAPATNCIAIADGLSYEQAASLPTVFLPCWSILMRHGALKPWETVLVLSASSGVGTAGIQLAKNVVGARVITTTSSPQKAEKAKALGADEVINYKQESIADRVKELTGGKGVDVVIDHVGADFWPAASRSLAVGGRYGICGATTGLKVELQVGLLFLKHQKIFGVFMGRNSDLGKIVKLAGRGTIRGVIAETFPLERAADAHRLMDETNFFGKIVLTVA
jgi:NADPH:quinone reductase-like Zn-dependent oxidoreductase